MTLYFQTIAGLEGLWRRGTTVGINIGGLAACVYLLWRTDRRYMNREEMERWREERSQRGNQTGISQTENESSENKEPTQSSIEEK